MDHSKSDDENGKSNTTLPRRQFLGSIAKATGGLLLADLAAGNAAHAQTKAPAVQVKKFTAWGWPEPYEQISAKSKQWLQSKGWWPLNAAWIVVWSGEEMVGHVLQTQKLLEKRGIRWNGERSSPPVFRTRRSFPAASRSRTRARSAYSHCCRTKYRCVRWLCIRPH
jgi:hypothetical protein